MVLHLAERLEVPLRERNLLLVAAGYAPVYPERPLQDPALEAARKVIDLVLAGYEPYPALAIDRHWTIIAANKVFSPLLSGVEPALLRPPVNITLSEVAIEAFLPADTATAEALRRLAAAPNHLP